MKKTIIISLVVVFVVLMAVPAFAAGSFTITEGEHGLEVSGEFPAIGKYIGKVFCDLPSLGFYDETWYQLEPFTLGVGGDIYDGGIDGISYFVVDGLRIEVQFAYIFDQDGYRLDYWQVFADGEQVDSTLFAIELIPYSEPVTGEGAAAAVLSVFSLIGDWMIAQIPVVSALFWSAEAGQLTALGSICVCALGVALILLLLSFVKRWIQFR